MFKIPHLEVNTIPSALNTSEPTGVAANLASVAQNEPIFDGVTLQQMKNNPLYDRIDDIDKRGLAQKKIAEAAKVIGDRKQAKLIRAFNDAITKPQKPNRD